MTVRRICISINSTVSGLTNSANTPFVVVTASVFSLPQSDNPVGALLPSVLNWPARLPHAG